MSIVQNQKLSATADSIDAMRALENADPTSQRHSEIDPDMSVIEAIYSRRSVRGYLYNNMGIEREDKEGRLRAIVRNFEFFDAPYIAFLGMNPAFGTTVALDVGMYAQSLMLTMVAFGLHSCPMGTMRNYPDMVREAFDIQDDTKILFGLSFGYEDNAVAANKTRTEREPISASVVFRS